MHTVKDTDTDAKDGNKTDIFHKQVRTNKESCDTLEGKNINSDLNDVEKDLKTESHAETETNPNVISTKERSKVGSIDISGGNNTHDSRGVFRSQAKGQSKTVFFWEGGGGGDGGGFFFFF